MTDPELARHRVAVTVFRPDQLCALVARIASEAGANATIGYLADNWINKHANEL
jgi:hypothetical protein